MGRLLLAFALSSVMATADCSGADKPYVPRGFDPTHLATLTCPENQSSLRLASRAQIEKVKRDIQSGKVTLRSGARADPSFDGLLIREDGKVGYPIRGRVAVLLVEEALALDRRVTPR